MIASACYGGSGTFTQTVCTAPLPKCGATLVPCARSLSSLPVSGLRRLLHAADGDGVRKTRPRPATLVLLLRGVAKGEPTARLARALGVSRKPLHTLRQRLQANLNATAPTAVMCGTAFEAGELYHNAGAKKPTTSQPHRSPTPARQSAHRAWHVCERSPAPHQHHLAGHGRAALVGLRPCEPTHLPQPDG
jgi:hypothetical protein